MLPLLFIITLYYFRSRPSHPYIQSIIIYPVRSCAGIRLSQAHITTTGLAYDRLWVFVNNEGDMVSAKNDPRLWRIQPILDISNGEEPKEMILTYEGKSIALDLKKPLGKRFTANMYDFAAEIAETGPEVASWIRDTLGTDYRLCRMIHPCESQEVPGLTVSFPDLRAHLLFASISSLSAVISSTPEPKRSQLTMSCFRPNIVIDGCDSWDEDTWLSIRIGNSVFPSGGPCDRCRMTSIDPLTLVFDEKTEPLPTLRRIHGSGAIAFFGQFFNRTEDGEVKVGDKIEVLEWKKFPS